MKKISDITQETGADIAKIKRLFNEIKFEVIFKLIRVYPQITTLFIQDPFLYLIIACEKEANKTRDSIFSTNNTMNIKFSRYFTIAKDKIILSRAINE